VPGFENYAAEARRIEQEMARQGVVLGIDWEDAVSVRRLAREALGWTAGHPVSNAEDRAKRELFALAQLMLKVMAESAGEDIHTHGGPIWKAFGRALWLESGQAG
jgi:hypothetical protein